MFIIWAKEICWCFCGSVGAEHKVSVSQKYVPQCKWNVKYHPTIVMQIVSISTSDLSQNYNYNISPISFIEMGF